MKIPFLILCLAVVYGACQTYTVENEENIDFIKELQNVEDDELNHANMPFETFLSRHRRSLGTTVLTGMITFPVKIMFNIILKILSTIMSKFMSIIMYTIKITIINPILSMMKTISSYMIKFILKKIGTLAASLINKALKVFFKFTKKVFLPVLHSSLMTLDKTGKLPTEVSAMIKMFDLTYRMMKMTKII